MCYVHRETALHSCKRAQQLWVHATPVAESSMTTMCWVSMSASIVSGNGTSRTVQAKACQLGTKHNQSHTRSTTIKKRVLHGQWCQDLVLAVLAKQTGCYVTTVYVKDSESMPRPVMSTSWHTFSVFDVHRNDTTPCLLSKDRQHKVLNTS